MRVLVYKETCHGSFYKRSKDTTLGTCLSCQSTNLSKVHVTADEIKSYSFYLCEAGHLQVWPVDMIAEEMTNGCSYPRLTFKSQKRVETDLMGKYELIVNEPGSFSLGDQVVKFNKIVLQSPLCMSFRGVNILEFFKAWNSSKLCECGRGKIDVRIIMNDVEIGGTIYADEVSYGGPCLDDGRDWVNINLHTIEGTSPIGYKLVHSKNSAEEINCT